MSQQSPQPEGPRRDYRNRHEKEEEKNSEKGEKTRGEKSWDEKWRRDPINAISWAAVFIWAGLGLLAGTTGYGPDTFSWWSTWAVILAGAGAIFIIAGLVRVAFPEHRRSIGGNLIVGFILLGVGIQEMTKWNWEVLGAFIFFAIALIIILSGVLRRRK